MKDNIPYLVEAEFMYKEGRANEFNVTRIVLAKNKDEATEMFNDYIKNRYKKEDFSVLGICVHEPIIYNVPKDNTMKVKIKQRVLEEIEIDVEFPFYFKHDLYSDYGDSIIYGKKIDDKTEYTIHVSKNYDGKITYEIEKDDFSNSYFEDKYKSNKTEYEKIKSDALEFLNQV